MEVLRSEKFISLISGVYRHISRLKSVFAPEMGIKSVHVFWLYQLRLSEGGMTSAELASASMVDRALVSRELEELKRTGLVVADGEGKGYGVVLRLTAEGEAVADRIMDTVGELQSRLDVGISEEELAFFYSTLEKLYNNFEVIKDEQECSRASSRGEKTLN